MSEQDNYRIKVKKVNGEYVSEFIDKYNKKWNGAGNTQFSAIRNLFSNIEIKQEKDEQSAVIKWLEINYQKGVDLTIYFGKCLGDEAKLLEFTTKGLSLRINESIEETELKLSLLSTFGFIKDISMSESNAGDPYRKWLINWLPQIRRSELETKLKEIDFEKKKLQKKIDLVNKEINESIKQ